jgi:hypothetical protein
MDNHVYKISPSVLSYGWDGCRHCFYRQVKYAEQQPSIQLPGIFSSLGSLAEKEILGQHTSQFCPTMPAGTVRYHELWVTSEPIMLSANAGVYFKGRFDIAVELDGGGYVIPDLKTGRYNERHFEAYSRQVHSYALALEHPAYKATKLSPVVGMGVLYWSPEVAVVDSHGLSYLGAFDWREVSRDDQAFMAVLEEVVDLLEGPEPRPEVCTTCAHCHDGSTCGAAKGGFGTGCTCCWWCVYRHGSGLADD